MKKKLLVPEYIYAGRTKEEFIPFFEEQFFKQVEFYDHEIASDPDKKLMGMRIGHAHFVRLKEEFEKKRDTSYKISSLGNEKFDWHFLPERINAESTVLAFGIGSDISFEEQLADTVGCDVHCFDPTPGALEFAVPIARRNPRIKLHSVGVFSRDQVVRFYKPVEKGLGSLSATNLTYSSVYLEAPVRRLLTIMRQLQVNKIDYLKIDIEGAEHGVIDDMLFSGILPDQIGLEFDQPTPPWKVESTIRKLVLAGYEMIDLWGPNCLFVLPR